MTIEEYFEQVDNAYDALENEALEKRLLELTEQVRKEYGEDGREYAAMCSELGGFYRGQGKFEDSERYFRDALMILVNTIGPDNPDYATALNNLAGTVRRLNRFDEAEMLFNQALTIYGDTVGTKHLLYASGLNNLSLVSLDRGDTEKATCLLGEAADILQGLPECRDELAAALVNLGSLHRQTGELDKAEEELAQAVELFEKELGTRTPHYHAALYGLSLTKINDGKIQEAKELMRKARTAATALYGPDNRETRIIDGYLRRLEEMK